MSITHISFYPSDWLAGTRGMMADETGVYITLIARMYEMAAPIERDDERLYRICGCKSKRAFVKIVDFLIYEGKIQEVNGELFQQRVAKEINKVVEKSSKAKAAAHERWNKKPNNNNTAKDADAMQAHMPETCQPKPEPKPDKNEAKASTKNDPVRFEEFWNNFPHRNGAKKGKDTAEAKYITAMKSGVSEDLLVSKAILYASDRQVLDGYGKSPTPWLNQKCWKDDIEIGGQNGTGFNNTKNGSGFVGAAMRSRASREDGHDIPEDRTEEEDRWLFSIDE